MAPGCCGLETPHVHVCYLGPLGWAVYQLVWWLRRRGRNGAEGRSDCIFCGSNAHWSLECRQL